MDDDWDGVNAALGRYGLPAKLTDRPPIIAALEEQIGLESREEGDHYVMRLLCVQIFSLGLAEDSLLVWRAKSCNFDTMCGIDVHLLCGAGLEPTKSFLAGVGGEDADEALEYLRKCEACGDFEGFSVERASAEHREDYGGMSPR
jgi:hypothetical protein